MAVGERGIVLLSDNHGQTWQQARTPVSVTLTNVRFVDAQHGWIVGHSGVVLSTSDGGRHWVRQLEGRAAAARTLQAARDSGAGAGSQALADAERLVADGPDKPFFDVLFLDPRRGLVVGAYGLILATEDGGASWRSIAAEIDNPKGKHLYALQADGERVYIAGEQGALYASTSGFGRFEPIATPYDGSYFGMLSSGAGKLLVFGLRGHACVTFDAGATWQDVANDRPATCAGGARLKDGTLLLVDEGGRLRRSLDQGRHFEPVGVPASFNFTAVAEAADGGIVLCGVRGALRLAPPTPGARKS